MSLYIVVGIVLITCALTFNGSLDRKIYLFITALLTAFLALRFGQGTDWAAYSYIYSVAPTSLDFSSIFYSNIYHSEIGWKILMNLFRITGIKFTTVSIVLSVFYMVIVGRSIYNRSTKPLLSMMLLFPTYYLTYFFSSLREGLVITLFLGIMLDMFEKENWLGYALVCIIAISIHRGSFFLVLVPIMSRLPFKSYQVIIPICLLFGIMGPIWIRMLAIDNYVSYAGETSVSLLAILYKVLSWAIVMLCLNIGGKKNLSATEESLIKIYMFGCAVYALFFRYELMASRFAAVLLSVEVILLPNLLSRGDARQQRVMLMVIIGMTCVMTAKNLDSYVWQGNYHSTINWLNYPYISIVNRDDIYNVRNGRFDIYLIDA